MFVRSQRLTLFRNFDGDCSLRRFRAKFTELDVGYSLRQSSVEGLDRKRSLNFPCPRRLRLQESFGREILFVS